MPAAPRSAAPLVALLILADALSGPSPSRARRRHTDPCGDVISLAQLFAGRELEGCRG